MWNSVVQRCSSLVNQSLVAAYFKGKSAFRRCPHSTQSIVNTEKMKILVLPALTDNYMYLIIDERTKEAAVVDPVAPDTVLEAVKREQCNLQKVLTTHHHWDHAGGNEAMMKKSPIPLQVYGGDNRIGALTNMVRHGDQIQIGDIRVECLFTPCHTSGHICYYIPGEDAAVFTGDTLFIGGCGRFFEGTAQQMYTALIEVLSGLPDETRVFCGHEYTEQNLRFARTVEPSNSILNDKIQWVHTKRTHNEPTVPSTIGEEKLTNPFMRVKESEIQEYAKTDNPIDVMGVIRQKKDQFKG